jgi:hypothetical protein
MKKMDSAVLYWKKALELDTTNAVLKKKIEQGIL